MQIFNHFKSLFIAVILGTFFFSQVVNSQVITSINTVRTAQSANNFWSRFGAQLKLDHSVDQPRVQREIRRLMADKKTFNTILARSTPYINYIFTQTQQQKMPAEIALVPYIESEFNPNDHNSAGALGLWQLMPGTARILGVKSSGYDGRRNLVASTKAALLFYNDLNVNFKGNWNLTFAAYNCGPGRVQSAVRRAGSRDFFKLSVPADTRYYVPRLLAIAEIVKHPKQYGITLPPVNTKA